jgi:hypothetical protein
LQDIGLFAVTESRCTEDEHDDEDEDDSKFISPRPTRYLTCHLISVLLTCPLISVLLLDLDSAKDFSQVFGRFFSSFQFTVEL